MMVHRCVMMQMPSVPKNCGNDGHFGRISWSEADEAPIVQIKRKGRRNKMGGEQRIHASCRCGNQGWRQYPGGECGYARIDMSSRRNWYSQNFIRSMNMVNKFRSIYTLDRMIRDVCISSSADRSNDRYYEESEASRNTNSSSGPDSFNQYGGLMDVIDQGKEDYYFSDENDMDEDWHPFTKPLLWKGDEAEAMQVDSLPASLPPSWKVILLSDGSVTRHLQLMTGCPVSVRVLGMKNIDRNTPGLPEAVSLLKEDYLTQRQVLLYIPELQNRPYVYACSWWSTNIINTYLKDRNQPIWVSLSKERTELYRQILEVESGHSAWLERKFDAKGPFWGRFYIFWHNEQPLTIIYEAFSTKLSKYCGKLPEDTS